MPRITIYRARIDLGNTISGLIFSYDPIAEQTVMAGNLGMRIWQTGVVIVQTPPGYELVDVQQPIAVGSDSGAARMVRDPSQGHNVYMRAARVIARVQLGDAGFFIDPYGNE